MAVSQSLSVTQVSQDISANTSQVRIYWTSTQSGASYNLYTRTAYFYVYLNGSSSYTRYSVSYNLPKGTTKVIVDKTITVAHKTDGSGSIKVTTWMDTDISAGVVEKSASLTLDTIPRATTPTLSASSVNMGNDVDITLPRASSSFTHDLAYSFNGASYVSFKTGAGSSYTWPVPSAATLAPKIPNATSGTMTIRCITKNGSTTIGTKYASLTVTIPSTVVPAQPTVAYSEADADLAAQFDALIQGKSKAALSIAATGIYDSTITAYQTVFQGKTYTGSSVTTDVITSYGDLAYKCRVKDSRGRWSAYKSGTIPVLQYKKPTISRFLVSRVNADGVEDDAGQFMLLEYSYNVTELNYKNTAAMTIQYKRSTEDSWTTLLTGTATSGVVRQVVDTVTFSVDYSYDVQMTVVDWFDAETVATATLLSGAVILDIAADGKGIAFGKTSEQAGIEFGWDIVNQVKSFGTLTGQYRTHDGLLIQWGTVAITPTAANTVTSVRITFPTAYSEPPYITGALQSNVPQVITWGVGGGATTAETYTGMNIYMTRTNLVATNFRWLAIGKA